MSSKDKNLSVYTGEVGKMPEDALVAIVVSEWNTEITGALLNAAVATLKENGIKDDDIIVRYVPGSFELPLGAKLLLDNAEPDAVICLGCVIQGETRHFDFICDSVANGIMTLGLEYNTPVIFGLLTPNNMQQAIDRAGGKHGNKGVEAAITALKLIALQYELETEE
jgi:6,7-dimethyl-8-ribityllumazine synthase